MSVGILGAGALGLTAGYRLAKRGVPVTLFEREGALGGLAAGFPVGPSYLEKFYHHIFATDRDAIALIDELGLGSKLIWGTPPTGLLYGDKIHGMDIPSLLLRFAPLGLPDRVRMIGAMAFLKATGNYRALERFTADAWIRRWMGDGVYRVVWGPVLKAKFGDRYDQIAMPWFWSRVHERSIRLGYLKGGFQQIYERLGDEIRSRGGSIQLDTEVSSIEAGADGVRVTAGGREHIFDRVLSTLPTRLFTRLARGLPDSYLREYDWGEHYGAHCLVLALDRPVGDVYWLNVNDPGYPFLVLVEHTNFMPPSDYGGRNLIYLGNYLPMGAPLFKKSKDEVIAEFVPAIQRIYPTFDPASITESWIWQAAYAQPIVTREYPRHIPPHTTPLPGVYLANMFQIYPQDRGQNYSIRMANGVSGLIADSLGSGQSPGST